MTAPDALRRKALSALREGRVTIVSIGDLKVMGVVKSSRQDADKVHVVDGLGANWHCTCQSVFAPECGHIAAVRMVTDHGQVTA